MMVDSMQEHDAREDDEFDDSEAGRAALAAIAEKLEERKGEHVRVRPASQPLFQTLFAQSIDRDDPVLRDFADHVVGPLSDVLGMTAAKGGAFFRKKDAEHAKNTERYQRDQTLRGHLINGMLPVLHIARYLARWNAKPMRRYDEITERLFIAGFMLHDYTKIPAVKVALEAAGFVEMEAPSAAKMPALEAVFVDWCSKLGLDAFLAPIGGTTPYIQDLIYVVHNTQQFGGTIHAPFLLPNKHTSSDVHMLAATLSHLADLLAYVARTPRDLVAHPTIRKALTDLGVPYTPGNAVAHFTYHHVAENRGLLLNFIHDAALNVLTVEDQRVPLLYAPSGVVYLERYDAPAMLDPAALTTQIVQQVRAKAAAQLISTGKGAKRGNVGLQIDDSYNDFFDLRELVSKSVSLVSNLIRNNKSADRLAPLRDNNWPGGANIPPLSSDPKDARLDQIAEWAGLMEVQFRDRLPGFDALGWLLNALGVGDLTDEFQALRDFPAAKKGGIKYWWFWVAAHVIFRNPGIQPDQVLERLDMLAHDLAEVLPEELPPSARVNEETWDDLAAYIRRVLTLGGTKAIQVDAQDGELTRYARAKGGRAKTICAICGSDYTTRKPAETAVSFQPGVYTARIRIGASDNGRSLCSICALEQLLRQLFMTNLDTGGTVEEQRVRYLSLYPSYFFTPETLRLVQRFCERIKEMRLSDKDLKLALQEATASGGAAFWQRLEPFMMRTDMDEPSRRVLRYSSQVQSTFLTIGFRNFNKPTDTESWVWPAFLALLLPICLDVKVVVSESSTPLLLEADDLPETIWFDGAHPAVQSLAKQDRIMVDDVLPILERLSAAYTIHLDTEYAPPKENWQRLPPLANSLMESPLYVFYYLKKQERDGKFVSDKQVRRYVRYAESVFNVQKDVAMSKAKKLVELYRGFYRAKNSNANSILRPLSVIADALLIADQHLFDSDEALTEVAYGELYRFMDRVSKGLADGRFPKGISLPERETHMQQFCEIFVIEVFKGVFRGDVAALRGKQLNLLRSACEVLYRNAQTKEWAERDQISEGAEPANDPNTDVNEA